MIPVHKQPEPKLFEQLVGQPGRAWLAKNHNRFSEKMPPLWQKILDDLWRAYGGVFAYYCFYIPKGAVGNATTDHFRPKSKYPDLAYSWDNYRLACLNANARKRNEVVLDPFTLSSETFLIDFLDGSVYPNPNNPPILREKCEQTIDVLKLNDSSCMRKRADDATNYLRGHTSLEYLRRHSPFVAFEIERQGLSPRLKPSSSPTLSDDF
ncbi:MAG: hypothetical protein IJS08_06465 [Victivallales bacterium]|nr:hypothetical protein [Victivallales bacterium]